MPDRSEAMPRPSPAAPNSIAFDKRERELRLRASHSPAGKLHCTQVACASQCRKGGQVDTARVPGAAAAE